MKQTYIFCLLLVSLFSNAQIINFSDSNFKNTLLLSNVAENLLGSVFNIDSNSNGEIEVSEAMQVSRLQINNSNISNISGIEFFINLKTLNCHNNELVTLNLSNNSNLEFLNCNTNILTSINLPNGSSLVNLNCVSNQLVNLDLSNQFNLVIIECDSNLITSLNVFNCTNLFQLSCSSNQLNSLNVSNNINLSLLNCGFNQLTNLDITNNLNLNELSCGTNQLTNLDVSNNFNLTKLGCSSNLLTSLNLLNNSNLEELFCESNLLSSLDISNNTMLINLLCSSNLLNTINFTNNTNLSSVDLSSNYLTSLDLTNQSNLDYFSFNNNQISTIDLSNIPNLQSLSCKINQLTTLNLSNNSNLQDLDCSSNPLQSLFIKNNSNETFYDYINNEQLLTFNFSNLPNLQYICADESQINDIQTKISEYNYTNCHVNTYCSFTPGGQFYTIQGQQKFDNENDGCDVSDAAFANLKFFITDGTTSGTLISNGTGNFAIDVQTGSHTITPILENPTYFTVSQSNVVVDFPTQTSPFVQDFCITPNGIHHDVEVSILPTNVARPGFDANYKIIYKNKGNQVENGAVNLQFNDAILDLVSTNPAFATQTINNLTFNYSNLQPFETREINVVFNVNSPMESPAVNSGDILNYTTSNTIVDTDEMLSDNTFVLNQTVVNSYDPNDKTCLQGNYVSPDKIGEFVHYMIRFENTGTFPAENIVVKDMIDTAKFDVDSLIPLHASHNYVTKIAGNKVEFIFENINLPFDDANNDGYVAFKIKTLPTLVLGNTFSNSANIYFDYNFPIITNTATTTIAALSNPSFEFANYFSLYPNPTSSELNINLKSAIEINSIQIYNTIGQLVTVQTGNALKVDVSSLKTGNYFIKINTNEGFSTSQFIKE